MDKAEGNLSRWSRKIGGEADLELSPVEATTFERVQEAFRAALQEFGRGDVLSWQAELRVESTAHKVALEYGGHRAIIEWDGTAPALLAIVRDFAAEICGLEDV